MNLVSILVTGFKLVFFPLICNPAGPLSVKIFMQQFFVLSLYNKLAKLRRHASFGPIHFILEHFRLYTFGLNLHSFDFKKAKFMIEQ